ncbi:MAG TPA: hypothetical protein VGJ02_04925 [Pyrinomonadaceae bacterium]
MRVLVPGATFKFFAILTFIFEAMMAIMMYLTWPRLMAEGPLTRADIIRLFTFYFLTTVVGAGLLFSRRWAAVMMSAATTIWGLWLIIGSILEVPFPFLLINISIGIVAMAPLLVTIAFWASLRSGGRFYL